MRLPSLTPHLIRLESSELLLEVRPLPYDKHHWDFVDWGMFDEHVSSVSLLQEVQFAFRCDTDKDAFVASGILESLSKLRTKLSVERMTCRVVKSYI